mmetsp:Transcript_98756/g.159195  ORF Transcript_98756/g.159195 Transcript_98756/m.159195 type:complete len:393 (+) Transcript_98756:3233-4411(+)
MNDKLVVVLHGRAEVARTFDLWSLDELLAERLVVALGHDTHVIKTCLDTPALALNQLHACRVVDKVRLDKLNAFTQIELALEHEVEMVEVQLQLLVCKVDTELLEMVGLEHLKPKNVQHRHLHCHRLALEAQRSVDALHNVVKELAVQGLAQGITALVGFFSRFRLHHHIRSCRDLTLAHGLDNASCVHAQQLRHGGEVLIILHCRIALAILTDTEVSNMQYGRDGRKDTLLALRIEPNEVKCLLGTIKTLDIVMSFRFHAGLGVIEDISGRGTKVLQHLLLRRGSTHLVEDVVVALARRLVNHTRLFKQVRLDLSTRNRSFPIKMHIDPFAETRRVVIAQRLGVAKGLEYGVGQHDLLLNGSRSPSPIFTHGCEHLQHKLGTLSLAGTRLS